MINNRLVALVVCAWLGLAPLSSYAKGLSYSYAEGGYTGVTSDSLNGTANGALARISFAALDYVHIKGEYTHFDSVEVRRGNFFGSNDLDIKVDRFLVGAGGNFTVLDKHGVIDAVDVLGTASYYDAANSGDNNNSTRGYQLEGGVRALFIKNLELNAMVTRLDVDNFDETGYGGGIVYKFYKKFSVSGNVKHFSQDSTTEYFVGLRLNF